MWRAVSRRSLMLWSDLSSAPKRKMARHSAFFANRAAYPSGSSGEFSVRRICRYRDSVGGECLRDDGHYNNTSTQFE